MLKSRTITTGNSYSRAVRQPQELIHHLACCVGPPDPTGRPEHDVIVLAERKPAALAIDFGRARDEHPAAVPTRTEQACSRRGIAQARAHEVDRDAGGIDGSGEGAPTALDTNVGLIDTPGLLGGLEMTASPLLKFGTVALDPAPAGRVVRFQAALAEPIFDIAERERVPKGPAHSTKN